MKLAALNEDWSDDSSCEPTEERVKEARVQNIYVLIRNSSCN